MKLFNKISNESNSNLKKLTFADGKPVTIQAALAQSVGITRDHMEDAAFSLVLQEGYCEQSKRAGLFIVADGMGGHMNGELASSIAIQKLKENLSPFLFSHQNDESSLEEVQQMIETAFKSAQQAVLEEVSGGGSTLTAALLINQDLYLAHVGDSRLYLVSKDGRTEVLTRDHSLVQRLVDLGQINQSEAELHPQKNVLYRALGQTDGFKVDFNHQKITAPGHLMLCSDGLWGLVDDGKMAEVICARLPIEERAEKLCDLANKAGGTDNISVIVLDVF